MSRNRKDGARGGGHRDLRCPEIWSRRCRKVSMWRKGAVAKRLSHALERAAAKRDLLRETALLVGNALFDARTDLDLSQAELARRAGTRQSRISQIETGNGNVRFATLHKVAHAAGLTITLAPRADHA